MRRITWVMALIICVSVVLVGCGKKNEAEIVKDLDRMMSKMESYQGVGKMQLNTGQQPQEYKVEVWYRNPHFYRISLTNEKKDITQIVLRNDDGVFVLTPQLNKSFRFQSDWPDKQGQVYLLQTLMQSIIADKDRQFAEDKKADAYVFDVAANYQNSSLTRQKIWLNRGNYAPKHVEVSDVNANVIVSVNFSEFDFHPSFDKDSFEMKRNMLSFQLQTLPTLSDEEADSQGNSGAASNEAVQENALGASDVDSKLPAVEGIAENQVSEANQAKDSKKASGSKASDENLASGVEQDFGVFEPAYVPTGVNMKDINEINIGVDKSPAVMLRYSGNYSYTLVETRPADRAVSLSPGTLMDLGYTLGVLTGDELKTLTWMSNGVEFRLSSGNLPPDEMVLIAQSVDGQIGK